MTQTIEARAAQTILQTPVEVSVGGKTYTAAPPSVATIILASQYTATLPRMEFSKERVLEDTLRNAKDCEGVSAVVATLLLGAKRINADIARRRHWWRRLLLPRLPLLQRTAKELAEGLTPKELHRLAGELLAGMEVADFFGLTTFLTEINMTRPTKVETEQTASGQ